MKKPAQTATGKVQRRLQRMQRRNYQKNATRKTGVHPVPEPPPEPMEPTNPTPVTRVRRKRYRMVVQPGQPNARSKLTLALTKKLCDLIRQQATLEDAAAKCHIARDRIWQWRTRGQQAEHPAYVAFERAITEALIDAKQKLVAGIAEDKDIRGKLFLLKNRYPKEYRDRIMQELTGVEGTPLILSENTFQVVLELDARDEPEVGKPFELVHPDGSRERLDGVSANGQEP